MSRGKPLPRFGYAILAIPDSGLFVREDGRLVTGHGTLMQSHEMPLFTRLIDAEHHAYTMKNKWEDGDKNGHSWDFPIVPVVVNERL